MLNCFDVVNVIDEEKTCMKLIDNLNQTRAEFFPVHAESSVHLHFAFHSHICTCGEQSYSFPSSLVLNEDVVLILIRHPSLPTLCFSYEYRKTS